VLEALGLLWLRPWWKLAVTVRPFRRSSDLWLIRYPVYCLDRLEKPSDEFFQSQSELAKKFEGSIHYKQVDVQDAKDLDKVVGEIASEHSRMDGLIAAAGVQNVTPALDYPPEKIGEVSTVMFHDRVW
jgi:NAD(P)-dependent dehydrogenase (short-subunit alcohol dehydrogenase family)